MKRKTNISEKFPGIEEALNPFQRHTSDNLTIDQIKKESNSLIKKLSNDKENFNKNNFNDELTDYLNKYDRILYSEVSVYIYFLEENGEENKIANITSNIESMCDFCLKINSENSKVMLKLYDHVNLAINQYHKLKISDDNFKERIEPVVTNINKTRDELNDTRKDIITQLISIVSIFVAIAFVMFGGMSLINGLFDFSGMNTVPIVELVCLGSIVGVVMVSVMYAFIIFVLRLSFRELGDKSPFRHTYLLSISSLLAIFLITFFIIVLENGRLKNVIPNWSPMLFFCIVLFFVIVILWQDFKKIFKGK